MEDNTADRGGGIWQRGDDRPHPRHARAQPCVGEELTGERRRDRWPTPARPTLENTTVSRNTAVDARRERPGRRHLLVGEPGPDQRDDRGEHAPERGTSVTAAGCSRTWRRAAADGRDEHARRAQRRGQLRGYGQRPDRVDERRSATNSAEGNVHAHGLNNRLVADARLGAWRTTAGRPTRTRSSAASPGIDKGGAGSCARDRPTRHFPARGAALRHRRLRARRRAQAGPPPPPPGDEELPDPVPHKNVNALPESRHGEDQAARAPTSSSSSRRGSRSRSGRSSTPARGA